jgi:hypothetical protein
VAEGISSLNPREKRTILNRISTLQGKPNTHAWNIQRSFQATVSLIFQVMDRGHHKRLQDHTHTNCAGHMSVARLHDPVFLSALQNVLPLIGACKHKIKVEWWRRVHLSGHSGTRLTAYHISWHVASTFKHLATTTTHFDLNHF